MNYNSIKGLIGSFASVQLGDFSAGLNRIGGSYDSLNLMGVTNATEDVRVKETVKSSGTLNVSNLHAESVTSNGTVTAKSINTKILTHNGAIASDLIESGAIQIDGNVQAKEVKAEQATIILRGPSPSKVEGWSVTELRITSEDGRLESDQIQAQRVELEGSTVRRVEASSVVIGRGCKVKELYYKTDYSIDPTSTVEKITQFN